MCVPSTLEDDKKRGFNHVEEIARTISSKVIKPFYKIKDWKQSSKKKKERESIKNLIKLSLLLILEQKKNLIHLI